MVSTRMNSLGKLIMLCGPAGCGKSTFASQLEGEVFSSDAIRKELYGDESIQTNPKQVFAILHQRIHDCIKRGGTAVYDATNTSKARRQNFIASIRAFAPECPCQCIYFACDLQTCIGRNQSRERKVPNYVIERQWNQLHNELPDYDEGWNSLIRVE